MAVSMVKIRAFIAGVFAIVVLIIIVSVGVTGLGGDIPFLRDIAGIFGVEPGSGNQ